MNEGITEGMLYSCSEEAEAARQNAVRIQQEARKRSAADDARLTDAQRAIEDLRERGDAAGKRADDAEIVVGAAHTDVAVAKARADAADASAQEARHERDAARQEASTVRLQAASAVEEARTLAGKAREAQVRAEALAEGATARAVAAEERARAADERLAAAVSAMAGQAAPVRKPTQNDVPGTPDAPGPRQELGHTALTGDTYQVRDKLTALGCTYDGSTKEWHAPDAVAVAAQAVVDEHSAGVRASEQRVREAQAQRERTAAELSRSAEAVREILLNQALAALP